MPWLPFSSTVRPNSEMEMDPDRADLDRMLLEYWSQPNTKQLNIRIPPAAKRMIDRLAKRKTVEVC